MAKAKATAAAPWGRALRRRTLVAVAVALLAVTVGAGWAWGRLVPARGPGVLAVAPGHVQSIMRRTEIAVADAEGVWRRALPEGFRGRYAEPGLVFFSRMTGTPCAGGGMVSGPFYCPETGVAAFDLAFMDALGARLRNGRDLGLALYVVRLSAEHLQRQLGLLDAASLEMIGARRDERRAVRTRLSLQADCLTGVWAAHAAPRIGQVPEGFYRQMVWSARTLVADLAREGVRVPPQFDPMASASEDERAAAFAAGYAAGKPAACSDERVG
jgi:predicted metalloprotease